MNLKTKIFVLVALSLFSVSLVSFPLAIAFSSDSYSQKVNDEFVWELKVVKKDSMFYSSLAKVGDQMKMVVTKTNSTLVFDLRWMKTILDDTVYVNVYNNTAANRTWTLLAKEVLIGAYNSTMGLNIAGFYIVAVAGAGFIPHNETAVNSTLYGMMMAMMGMANYTWTSGPNKFDGLMEAWAGPKLPLLNNMKLEIKFNANGVVEYIKQYNGTGSAWDLISHSELVGGVIPGFLAVPLLLILSIFVAFQLLRTKKKPVAM